MSAPNAQASTYRTTKRLMAQKFRAAGLPFADEDAFDLLLGLTGLSHADYIMNGADALSPAEFDALNQAAQRRLHGVPVDRILGWREFYGRRFAIDNVLSPRGDTEVLLLAAIDALQNVQNPTFIDLGTGSGALAVSLLCEREDAAALATDIAADALKTAQINAVSHRVADRLTLLQSNWFESIPNRKVDAILSNPPYITTDAMDALDREVAAHDPGGALHGGEDGLDPYRTLIPKARGYLKPSGWLGVEIGFDQGSAVIELFRAHGYCDIHLLQDPAGLDRMVCGQV